MKRLNLKLLIGLLIACMVIAGTAYGLWMFQMQRNSRNFLVWADEADKKGNVEDALDLYRRYLRYDRHNVAVLNKYAMAMSEDAHRPKSHACADRCRDPVLRIRASRSGE